MGHNIIAARAAHDNIVATTSQDGVVSAERDIRRGRNILLMMDALDLQTRNARNILAVHLVFRIAILDGDDSTINVMSHISGDFKDNIVTVCIDTFICRFCLIRVDDVDNLFSRLIC